MNIKTTKKTLSLVLITTVLSLISFTAIAEDAPAISGYGVQSASSSKWCKGNIKDVWVQNNGLAYIHGDWRGTHTTICSVTASWKGVKPETCAAWLGIAQQAYATQTGVILRYKNISSCKSIPIFGNAPAPDYIMLRKS